MNPHETAQTITPDHLVRKAVVYLRQSSLQQVKHNLESQRLQYALADRAKALELNPVAAGMVQSPEQYRWSSYRWHAWGEPNPLLSDHDLYVRLGASEHDRQCAYRELFRARFLEIDIHDIRECLAYNHPLGNDRFREQVETTVGRRVGQRQRGRPPKHVDAPT